MSISIFSIEQHSYLTMLIIVNNLISSSSRF
nr:MAG TPA: hypothetical protein [Bacteriophage sp.]